MNNCLHTEFKKQAQNSNLPYLGNVTLFCEVIEGLSRYFTITTDGTKTHDLNVDYGDLTFKDGNNNPITKIIPPNNKAYYNSSTENSCFRISERYHITAIEGTRLGIDLGTLSGMSLLTKLIAEKSTLSKGDIGNLKNLTALTSLEISGDASYPNTTVYGNTHDLITMTGLTSLKLLYLTGITGNISDFNSLVNATEIGVYYCPNVIGEIQSLGSLTALEMLNINGTTISGDGLELVKRLCTHGKTTGVLEVKNSGTITVGDRQAYDIKCTWDSTNSTVTITNRTGTVTYATYHWDSDTVS